MKDDKFRSREISDNRSLIFDVTETNFRLAVFTLALRLIIQTRDNNICVYYELTFVELLCSLCFIFPHRCLFLGGIKMINRGLQRHGQENRMTFKIIVECDFALYVCIIFRSF